MAEIYEINGHKVEFANTPTEADIDEASKQFSTPQQKTQGENPVRDFINKTNLGAGIPLLNLIPTSGAELGDFVKNAARFVTPPVPSTEEDFKGTPFEGASTASLIDKLTKPQTQYGKNLETGTNVAGVAAGIGLLAKGGLSLINKLKSPLPPLPAIEEMATQASREFVEGNVIKNLQRDAEKATISKLYNLEASDAQKKVDLASEEAKKIAYDLQTKGKDQWFKFHKDLNDEFAARRNALVDKAGLKNDAIDNMDLKNAYGKVVEKFGLETADPSLMDSAQKRILNTYKRLSGEDVPDYEVIGDINSLDSKIRDLRNGIRGKQFGTTERVQSDLAYNLDKILDEKVSGLKPLRAEFSDRYKFKNEAWNLFHPTKDTLLDHTAYGILNRVAEGKGTPQDVEFVSKLKNYFGGDFVNPLEVVAQKKNSLLQDVGKIDLNKEYALKQFDDKAVHSYLQDVRDYNGLLDTILAMTKERAAQDRIKQFAIDTSLNASTGGKASLVKGVYNLKNRWV